MVHVYDDAIYVGQSFWVGVAVEIGTEQIWAGEILVAITALPTSTVSNMYLWWWLRWW